MKEQEMEIRFIKDLLEKRILYLGGFIDGAMIEKISKEIIWLNVQSKNDITLYINSDGGNIGAGFTLYDVINLSESITTGIVLKTASSMMIAALQGCKKRKALKHSVFNFHDLAYKTETTRNNRNNTEHEREEITKRQIEYNRIVGDRIIGGPEKVGELCENNKVLS